MPKRDDLMRDKEVGRMVAVKKREACRRRAPEIKQATDALKQAKALEAQLKELSAKDRRSWWHGRQWRWWKCWRRRCSCCGSGGVADEEAESLGELVASMQEQRCPNARGRWRQRDPRGRRDGDAQAGDEHATRTVLATDDSVAPRRGTHPTASCSTCATRACRHLMKRTRKSTRASAAVATMGAPGSERHRHSASCATEGADDDDDEDMSQLMASTNGETIVSTRSCCT